MPVILANARIQSTGIQTLDQLSPDSADEGITEITSQ